MITISDILTIQAPVPMPNSAPSSRLDLPDHPGVTSWQRPRQSDAKEALLMKHTTGEECNKGQLSLRNSWGATSSDCENFCKVVKCCKSCKSSMISYDFVQSRWVWNQRIASSKPFSDLWSLQSKLCSIPLFAKGTWSWKLCHQMVAGSEVGFCTRLCVRKMNMFGCVRLKKIWDCAVKHFW